MTGPPVAVAVLLAVAAAGCFAAAAVLQHDAVRRHGATRAWRSRRWWSGGLAAALGAGGHATALALAPLSVVQPLGVLAVPLGVLFERRAGSRAGNVTAIACAVSGVVGGVALFTMATAAAAGDSRPPADPWRVLAVVAAVAVVAALPAAALAVLSRTAAPDGRAARTRRWTGPARRLASASAGSPVPVAPGGPVAPAESVAPPAPVPAWRVHLASWLSALRTSPTARCLVRAAPAAVAFGLVSALLRTGLEIVARGPDASLVWLGAAALVALAAGGAGVQSAFRSGPPSLVVACLTVVDPIAAVGVGALALDERIATGPAGVLAAVTGGVLAVGGVLLLARHHPDVVARTGTPDERPTDPIHPCPAPRRPWRPFTRRRP